MKERAREFGGIVGQTGKSVKHAKAGQRCAAGTRITLFESVYEAFKQKLRH